MNRTYPDFPKQSRPPGRRVPWYPRLFAMMPFAFYGLFVTQIVNHGTAYHDHGRPGQLYEVGGRRRTGKMLAHLGSS